MTVKQKWMALFTAAGLATAGLVTPNVLHSIQYAKAEAEVQASREQIATVGDLAGIYKAVNKAVEPSVVMISVTKKVKSPIRGLNRDFLRRFMPDQDGDGQPDMPDDQQNEDAQPPQQEEQGTGSGVLMDVEGNTGYILTNNHVAGDASEMKVSLSDGRTIDNCKLVGADPKSDLAVVKIQADGLIAAKWGDSDKLEKGDLIVAFGAPFGYVGSMTHGIVSALHRQAHIISSRYGYESFIQVDAPINPGNSGGPLVDLRGSVVGINTAIATESGGFQGIGFAIPSSQAHYVYDAIKSKGKVVRGWLGVGIFDVAKTSPEELTSLGYSGKTGVKITQNFKDTPAYGKLSVGDIITQLNGKPVADVEDLRYQIAKTSPGTTVNMKVFHDGKEVPIDIKLGEQPEDTGSLAEARNGRRGGGQSSSIDSIGVRAADASEELLQKYKLDNSLKGAVVTGVIPGSRAWIIGLRQGDVITKVNGTEVSTVEELNDALTKADLKKGAKIYWTNAEGEQYGFVRVK